MTPAPTKPLLSVLSGGIPSRIPIWLMRQAGRYLPEYRALRAEKGGFLELVYDPRGRGRDHAPADPPLRLRRRDPVLRHPDRAARARPGSALRGRRGAAACRRRWSTRALAALAAASGAARADLSDCGESEGALARRNDFARLCRQPVDGRDLYGGGPGQPRPGRGAARSPIAIRRRSPAIVDAIAAMTVDYLSGQIEAGAEAVQLFDSWAGSLVAGPVRALGDRADRADRRGAQGAASGRAGDRLSQGRRRQARRLCARDRGRCARPRRDGRSRLGGARAARRTCRSRAISIRSRCSPAARRLKRAVGRILSSLRGQAAHLQPRPRHHQGNADRPCRAACSRWCAR